MPAARMPLTTQEPLGRSHICQDPALKQQPLYLGQRAAILWVAICTSAVTPASHRLADCGQE